MHSFLGSIGFSNIKNRSDLVELQKIAEKNATDRFLATLPDHRVIAELRFRVSESIGLSLFGEYDAKEHFLLEHYYPYMIGQNESSRETVFVSKRVDTDAFTGMCEDYRLGVSLIFYLQNVIDYLTLSCPDDQNAKSITLAALSSEGKILLPTLSMKEAKVATPVEEDGRDKLVEAARNGDKEAMEALSIGEIDMYEKINSRLKNEDVFSIVETTFIPYGSESDNYTILANIDAVEEQTNEMTGEELYILSVRCNGIAFPICINKKDLLGEPLPGRRFRGNIWMQGEVDFSVPRKATEK